MKEFNSEKFCKDLVSLRGKESQDVFTEIEEGVFEVTSK